MIMACYLFFWEIYLFIHVFGYIIYCVGFWYDWFNEKQLTKLLLYAEMSYFLPFVYQLKVSENWLC